jgi:predicted nucleic acid-binding protein
MNGAVFVDTNVLVYARDASEPDKRPVAASWLHRLWEERAGRLSSQVLHEYYVTVTERLDPGLDRETARADVRSLLVWRPISLDAGILEGAWAVQNRHRLSFWDSLIVSAAQASGCEYLLTEDLQDEQDLDGLEVIDPFRRSPDAILG